MRGFKLGPITIGRAGYAVACVAAAVTLVVAGYAHEVVGLTDALGHGASLGSAPSAGPVNILVMGLESRTDFQGQDLSVKELTETHSGNESAVAAGLEGSQDTDTLILIHIFAGGQKAVGFSIPRDDVVNYPHATYDGLTEGKIDAAYAFAYDQSLGQTAGSDLTRAQRYLTANQAGQLFEVQTVESVTGVHIDHFIESNIIGFYELAQQFGGLEVCIRPAPAQGGLPAGANLSDFDPLTGTDNSGFSAYHDGYDRKTGGRQYLHLSAAQSLAYVRSRDTLPGVDIGRTARQQAAIEYLLWKMKTSGVLSDIGTLTTLLSNAKSYVMYDSGWDLIGFAQDVRALSSSNLKLKTLPEISINNVDIPGYDGLQSANYIDVPQIQRQVHKAFYGSSPVPATAPSVPVRVYDGTGSTGPAAGVAADLAAMRYKASAPGGSPGQAQPSSPDTEVFYGAGSAAAANAQVIADVMGVQAATPSTSLPAGQVQVVLGSQVTAQAPGLEMFAADSVNAADYVSAAEQNGQSIAASVRAADSAGSESDVPAYAYVKATPSGPAASAGVTGSVTPSPSTSSGSRHSSSRPARRPRVSHQAPTPNPPYGLTTCPY